MTLLIEASSACNTAVTDEGLRGISPSFLSLKAYKIKDENFSSEFFLLDLR